MTADTSDRFSAQDVSAHVGAAQPLQRRRVLAALAVGVASSPLAWAQSSSAASTWPNARPIRIVVAFPPGGLTDAYARLYAEQLSAQLGITAVVDNKPGAGAILGIDHVAKSAPDGYTSVSYTHLTLPTILLV